MAEKTESQLYTRSEAISIPSNWIYPERYSSGLRCVDVDDFTRYIHLISEDKLRLRTPYEVEYYFDEAGVIKDFRKRTPEETLIYRRKNIAGNEFGIYYSFDTNLRTEAPKPLIITIASPNPTHLTEQDDMFASATYNNTSGKLDSLTVGQRFETTGVQKAPATTWHRRYKEGLATNYFVREHSKQPEKKVDLKNGKVPRMIYFRAILDQTQDGRITALQQNLNTLRIKSFTVPLMIDIKELEQVAFEDGGYNSYWDQVFYLVDTTITHNSARHDIARLFRANREEIHILTIPTTIYPQASCPENDYLVLETPKSLPMKPAPIDRVLNMKHTLNGNTVYIDNK